MSNPLDIHKALNEFFKPSRFQRQKDIEDSIMKFCPDFMEAKEILDAVVACLTRRYEQDISDVMHEAKQLAESLLEADATEEREHDEWNNRLRTISEKE